MFCKKCGKEIEDGASFCRECGFFFGNADEKMNAATETKKKKSAVPGKIKIAAAFAAGLLALSLGVGLIACGKLTEEKSAGEVGAENSKSESNQEENPEAEEIAAEVNPEAEEAAAEVNPEAEEAAAEVNSEAEEAEETEEIEETAEVEKTEEELLLAEAWNPQDYDSDNLSIIFGSYEQDNNLDNGAEPLEWNVIKEEDGKVLLICRYGIEAMQYHTSDDDVTWETCSLRQWLNHDFIDMAFDDEKEDIQLSLLENKDGMLSKGGNTTQDYVFLLSEEEFNENMEFDAKTQLSEYAGKKVDTVYIKGNFLARAWLRTPGAAQNAAAVIDIQGHLEREGDYNCMAVNAVRPAMWVTKTPEIEAQMMASEDLKIGSYVTLGHYEQNINLDGLEPIEWQILDRKDGKALLISRYILDRYTCDDSLEFLKVRDWLNNDFYNTAFDEEKEYIVETNQEYEGFSGTGRRYVDSVFLLSSTEVETYFDGNETNTRAAVGTAYVKDFETWWMRDKKIRNEWDSPNSEDIACVNKFGKFVQAGSTHGIRPAIWVDMAVLKSELAVPEEQGYGDIDSVLHLVEGVEGNVTFGTYEQDGNLENGQEPIEWLILSREDDRMLLISKYVLDAQYYYEINTSAEHIGWEDSTVRTWLNSDFYNTAFNDEEKKYIPLSKVISSWGHEPVIEETDDYVFLLSGDEVEAYFDVDGGKYHDELKCEQTEYATQRGAMKNRWMVRCYKFSKYSIDAINAYGTCEGAPDNPSNGGVRPAIWVNVNG